MSDRLRGAPEGTTKTSHPIGAYAKWVEEIARLRAAFGAPVIALTGDRGGITASALRTALGGIERTGLIDWRDGAPRQLRDGLMDPPAAATALIVVVDPAVVKRAGAAARALAPDVMLYAGGIDPAICFETMERLGSPEAVVLDRDDPRHGQCLDTLRTLPRLRCVDYGRHAGADVRLIDCQLYTSCSSASVRIGRDVFDLCMGAPGLAFIDAALATLATVRVLGGDVTGAASRFAAGPDAHQTATTGN
ncbi:hypothetical protein KAJ83_11975 [Marivibrio halodurans]|uniref:Uncharacterized protein n=1 Tax=Marivibrio halodurans TaxID=2039722 RepID=A0A8J7S361_9PROT|nr:hypothetical protein [Marivibrio halodurans]MBP5857728.1 hypothetical protein [Marivibrio halodurans]